MKLHHLLFALSLSACALPAVAQKPLVRQKPAPAKTTTAKPAAKTTTAKPAAKPSTAKPTAKATTAKPTTATAKKNLTPNGLKYDFKYKGGYYQIPKDWGCDNVAELVDLDSPVNSPTVDIPTFAEWKGKAYQVIGLDRKFFTRRRNVKDVYCRMLFTGLLFEGDYSLIDFPRSATLHVLHGKQKWYEEYKWLHVVDDLSVPKLSQATSSDGHTAKRCTQPGYTCEFVCNGLGFNFSYRDGYEGTVEVCAEIEYRCEAYFDYFSSYSGAIEVPDYIVCDGQRYTVSGIDNYAFNDCDITSVKLPETITYIGTYAFGHCSKLKSVNIPRNIKEIGYAAFSECLALPVVDGVRYAGDCAIGVIDRTRTSYTLRPGTRHITEAFSWCEALKHIDVPEGVINIFATEGFNGDSGGAFEYSNIESISLPTSIVHIDPMAFSNCEHLRDIYLHAPLPPDPEDDLYYWPDAVTIHVPAASLQKYLQTSRYQNCRIVGDLK